jgi:hypothetical protein
MANYSTVTRDTEMSFPEWILLILMIINTLIGGYFQIQMLANSKEGALSSLWKGAWIFHPELLKEKGLGYRQKLFFCLGVLFVLMLMMLALNR